MNVKSWNLISCVLVIDLVPKSWFSEVRWEDFRLHRSFRFLVPIWLVLLHFTNGSWSWGHKLLWRKRISNCAENDSAQGANSLYRNLPSSSMDIWWSTELGLRSLMSALTLRNCSRPKSKTTRVGLFPVKVSGRMNCGALMSKSNCHLFAFTLGEHFNWIEESQTSREKVGCNRPSPCCHLPRADQGFAWILSGFAVSALHTYSWQQLQGNHVQYRRRNSSINIQIIWENITPAISISSWSLSASDFFKTKNSWTEWIVCMLYTMSNACVFISSLEQKVIVKSSPRLGKWPMSLHL